MTLLTNLHLPFHELIDFVLLVLVEANQYLKIPNNGIDGRGLVNALGVSIIRDHNNQNVSVSATGGQLLLGYSNTTKINFLNGKSYINNDGSFSGTDMIIDYEDLANWSENTKSTYSIDRLLNSEGELQILHIYPLGDDEIETFLQAQEITDDNEAAFDYLQKKHSIYEPIHIYIGDKYLFYDIDDYDIFNIDIEIKGYGETSKFKKLLRKFIEKEVGVDVPACLIRTKLQPIYIYDEHFSRIEHKRTVSSFYHSNLFVKNVRIPNFSISIPVLIRPLMLANFEINIFSENCYPDVSRTRLNDDTCKLLGYAIGRAIHIYILKQANLKAHEKEFLSAFIKKYYKYDPNNEFCKKTK